MMLSSLAIAHPRKVIAFWVGFLLLGGVLALGLNGEVKAGGFNDPRGEAFVGQQVKERAFDDPPNTAQIVLSAATPITERTLDAVRQAASSVDGVTGTVDSRTAPVLTTPDGTTQVVDVAFSVDNTTTQNRIETLRAAVADSLTDDRVTSSVTGAPALDYDLNAQSKKDALHAEMIAFPLLIIILLVVFQSVGPVLVALAVAAVSLAGVQGIGYLLARVTDISNLYVTGASLIGLAVAVDYSIFILKRFREGLDAGQDAHTAALSADATAGRAVRFGGIAVIAALAALFISRNMVFSTIALSGIVVTVIALAAIATLLPAVLSLTGSKLFFGNFRIPGRRRRVGGDRLGLALRHPRWTATIVAAALALLALPMSTIELQVPVASADVLPESADSRRALDQLDGKIDARQLFPVEVVIATPSTDGIGSAYAASTQIVDAARTSGRVTSVIALTGLDTDLSTLDNQMSTDGQILDGTGRPLARTVDGTTFTRVIVYSTEPPDSTSTHDLVDTLRAATDDLAVTTYVTGATAQGADFDLLVATSIPWIVGAVLVISVLLLGWTFRSRWLPLIAVALNALVVSAALGILTLLWRWWHSESINSVTPVLMFAIIFGLSMDYMVVMVSRMQEEYAHHPQHLTAISRGSAKTARLVLSAAIIMIGVFLSFLVAEVDIVQQLGIGLAIAVALDALIVRPFLMPATMAALGPRIWGHTAPRHENTHQDRSPRSDDHVSVGI